MLPFLDIKIFKIPMYGLCIVIGIISGGIVAKKLCSLRNKNFLDFIIISTLSLSIAFIFAKLFYIFISVPIKYFFKYLIFILFKDSKELQSGFVFYGGLFGGILGYFIGTKIAKCYFEEFFDIFAVIIPYAHAFGRIGCFCAGCCYGIELKGCLVFPVQLLESFLLFILFVLLLFLFCRQKKNLLPYYLFFYSIIRFCTEFFRGDIERGFLGCFSTSQWISLLIFISILSIYLIKKVKRI